MKQLLLRLLSAETWFIKVTNSNVVTFVTLNFETPADSKWCCADGLASVCGSIVLVLHTRSCCCVWPEGARGCYHVTDLQIPLSHSDLTKQEASWGGVRTEADRRWPSGLNRCSPTKSHPLKSLFEGKWRSRLIIILLLLLWFCCSNANWIRSFSHCYFLSCTDCSHGTIVRPFFSQVLAQTCSESDYKSSVSEGKCWRPPADGLIRFPLLAPPLPPQPHLFFSLVNSALIILPPPHRLIGPAKATPTRLEQIHQCVYAVWPCGGDADEGRSAHHLRAASHGRDTVCSVSAEPQYNGHQH